MHTFAHTHTHRVTHAHANANANVHTLSLPLMPRYLIAASHVCLPNLQTAEEMENLSRPSHAMFDQLAS